MRQPMEDKSSASEKMRQPIEDKSSASEKMSQPMEYKSSASEKFANQWRTQSEKMALEVYLAESSSKYFSLVFYLSARK